MPDDPHEDQTSDEDEQSPADNALERLKSHLSTTAGRIVLALVGVALIALIIGLVRACGGAGDPVKSLSEAAAEIAEEFDDDAFEIGGLQIPANDVVYHARNLAQIPAPEYDDLDGVERTFRAAEHPP